MNRKNDEVIIKKSNTTPANVYLAYFANSTEIGSSCGFGNTPEGARKMLYRNQERYEEQLRFLPYFD